MTRFSIVALTVVTSLAPATAFAQETELSGMVVDSATNLPIPRVTVTLVDHNLSRATDEEGAFLFSGLTTGIYTLTFRRLGYQPIGLRFQLNAAGITQASVGVIQLVEMATELDPVRIEADVLEEYPQLAGFFRRKATIPGTFFTEADITRERPRTTSDFLRRLPQLTGSETGRMTSARGSPGLSSAFSGCTIGYFINGVQAHAGSVDVVLPETIVGIEVYSGTSTVPIEFSKMNGTSCGVVVIWTRHTRR